MKTTVSMLNLLKDSVITIYFPLRSITHDEFMHTAIRDVVPTASRLVGRSDESSEQSILRDRHYTLQG